jgi:AraC-like DNA-binding protein
MPTGTGGLFRAVLAGPGRSLSDAFANLERAPSVQQVIRHPHRNLVGARITLTPEEGQGYWDFTKVGDQIFVVVGDFAYKDPRVEVVPGDGLVQFYFNLCGDLTFGVSRTEPLRFNRPSLLVYSQPPGVDYQEWTAPSARERLVAITLPANVLAENFLSPVVTAPQRLQALLSGAPGRFEYCLLPLSTQMFELATRLVDNPYSGQLALVYTEALTLELLCAAIASFGNLNDVPMERFSDHSLRRLHAARLLLMKRLAPAPTIRQIAKAVGMNETSLKRGFKAVFGETIFDFSVRCRMQHALRLLREQHLSVALVAEAVGYSHQTSFATAFRRHFGMRPRDSRQPRPH